MHERMVLCKAAGVKLQAVGSNQSCQHPERRAGDETCRVERKGTERYARKVLLWIEGEV